MVNNIFLISLSNSVIILLLLIISPFLNKRYSAKCRYFIWLALALRLVVPFRFEMTKALVNIPVTNHTVVFKAEGVPVTIMNDSYIERGVASHESADYAPIISLNDLFTILWIIGAVSFFAYHIINYIDFKKKIKPYLKSIDKNIYECSKIKSPMMIGFFKPTILLPCMEYTNEELAVIIKHEMTHFKRGDIWCKLLLIAANSMHWFNPLVYFMRRQANRDLEYSCDDAVVKDCDINYRKTYSMAILKAMQKDEATTLSTYLNGGSDDE